MAASMQLTPETAASQQLLESCFCSQDMSYLKKKKKKKKEKKVCESLIILDKQSEHKEPLKTAELELGQRKRSNGR